MSKKRDECVLVPVGDGADYEQVLHGMVTLLEQARRASARAVNVFVTATYWELGRRIVEFDQGGKDRSVYGEGLLKRLAADLTARLGRGFSLTNLKQFRKFYLLYRTVKKSQTPSDLFPLAEPLPKGQTVSDLSPLPDATGIPLAHLAELFPLPWSHYVLLLKVEKSEAREFYEAEAHRNGWKDPFVLEFLGLKDEYSESDLEEALIRELETFLLELGGDFTFVGRQKRLRIGDEWYRIDLLFFHRKLRCLVVIDLKLGKFTHADAGQMHLYLNYARKHWTNEWENPPVGVILCTQKDSAVVHYALEDLPNKILAAEYRTTLPDEKTLVAELETKRRLLESRTKPAKGGQS